MDDFQLPENLGDEEFNSLFDPVNQIDDDPISLFSADDLIAEAELRPWTPTTNSNSNSKCHTPIDSTFNLQQQQEQLTSSSNNALPQASTHYQQQAPVFSIPSPRVTPTITCTASDIGASLATASSGMGLEGQNVQLSNFTRSSGGSVVHVTTAGSLANVLQQQIQNQPANHQVGQVHQNLNLVNVQLNNSQSGQVNNGAIIGGQPINLQNLQGTLLQTTGNQPGAIIQQQQPAGSGGGNQAGSNQQPQCVLIQGQSGTQQINLAAIQGLQQSPQLPQGIQLLNIQNNAAAINPQSNLLTLNGQILLQRSGTPVQAQQGAQLKGNPTSLPAGVQVQAMNQQPRIVLTQGGLGGQLKQIQIPSNLTQLQLQGLNLHAGGDQEGNLVGNQLHSVVGGTSAQPSQQHQTIQTSQSMASSQAQHQASHPGGHMIGGLHGVNVGNHIQNVNILTSQAQVINVMGHHGHQSHNQQPQQPSSDQKLWINLNGQVINLENLPGIQSLDPSKLQQLKQQIQQKQQQQSLQPTHANVAMQNISTGTTQPTNVLQQQPVLQIGSNPQQQIGTSQQQQQIAVSQQEQLQQLSQLQQQQQQLQQLQQQQRASQIQQQQSQLGQLQQQINQLQGGNNQSSGQVLQQQQNLQQNTQPQQQMMQINIGGKKVMSLTPQQVHLLQQKLKLQQKLGGSLTLGPPQQGGQHLSNLTVHGNQQQQQTAQSSSIQGSLPSNANNQNPVSQIVFTSQGVQNIQVAGPNVVNSVQNQQQHSSLQQNTLVTAINNSAAKQQQQQQTLKAASPYQNIQPKPSPIQQFFSSQGLSALSSNPRTASVVTVPSSISTVLTMTSTPGMVSSINPSLFSARSTGNQSQNVEQQIQHQSLAGLLAVSSNSNIVSTNASNVATSAPLLSKAFGISQADNNSNIIGESSVSQFRSPIPFSQSSVTTVSSTGKRGGKGKQASSRSRSNTAATDLPSPRGSGRSTHSGPSSVQSMPPPSPYSLPPHSPHGSIGYPGSVQSLPPPSPQSLSGMPPSPRNMSCLSPNPPSRPGSVHSIPPSPQMPTLSMPPSPHYSGNIHGMPPSPRVYGNLGAGGGMPPSPRVSGGFPVGASGGMPASPRVSAGALQGMPQSPHMSGSNSFHNLSAPSPSSQQAESPKESLPPDLSELDLFSPPSDNTLDLFDPTNEHVLEFITERGNSTSSSWEENQSDNNAWPNVNVQKPENTANQGQMGTLLQGSSSRQLQKQLPENSIIGNLLQQNSPAEQQPSPVQSHIGKLLEGKSAEEEKQAMYAQQQNESLKQMVHLQQEFASLQKRQQQQQDKMPKIQQALTSLKNKKEQYEKLLQQSLAAQKQELVVQIQKEIQKIQQHYEQFSRLHQLEIQQQGVVQHKLKHIQEQQHVLQQEIQQQKVALQQQNKFNLAVQQQNEKKALVNVIQLDQSGKAALGRTTAKLAQQQEIVVQRAVVEQHEVKKRNSQKEIVYQRSVVEQQQVTTRRNSQQDVMAHLESLDQQLGQSIEKQRRKSQQELVVQSVTEEQTLIVPPRPPVSEQPGQNVNQQLDQQRNLQRHQQQTVQALLQGQQEQQRMQEAKRKQNLQQMLQKQLSGQSSSGEQNNLEQIMQILEAELAGGSNNKNSNVAQIKDQSSAVQQMVQMSQSGNGGHSLQTSMQVNVQPTFQTSVQQNMHSAPSPGQNMHSAPTSGQNMHSAPTPGQYMQSQQQHTQATVTSTQPLQTAIRQGGLQTNQISANQTTMQRMVQSNVQQITNQNLGLIQQQQNVQIQNQRTVQQQLNQQQQQPSGNSSPSMTTQATPGGGVVKPGSAVPMQKAVAINSNPVILLVPKLQEMLAKIQKQLQILHTISNRSEQQNDFMKQLVDGQKRILTFGRLEALKQQKLQKGTGTSHQQEVVTINSTQSVPPKPPVSQSQLTALLQSDDTESVKQNIIGPDLTTDGYVPNKEVTTSEEIPALIPGINVRRHSANTSTSTITNIPIMSPTAMTTSNKEATMSTSGIKRVVMTTSDVTTVTSIMETTEIAASTTTTHNRLLMAAIANPNPDVTASLIGGNVSTELDTDVARTGTGESSGLVPTVVDVGAELAKQKIETLMRRMAPNVREQLQSKLTMMSPTQQQAFYREQYAMLIKLQKRHLAKQKEQQQQQQTASATQPGTIGTSNNLQNQNAPALGFQRAIQLPKGKSALHRLPRAQLFQLQLNKDQMGALKPDYKTPFKDYKDAIKRLLKYHVWQDRQEKPREVEAADAEYNEYADKAIQQLDTMLAKYQRLMHNDSARHSPSAEMVMIERMFLAEERQQLEQDRQTAQQHPDMFRPAPYIKPEVKEEPLGSHSEGDEDESGPPEKRRRQSSGGIKRRRESQLQDVRNCKVVLSPLPASGNYDNIVVKSETSKIKTENLTSHHSIDENSNCDIINKQKSSSLADRDGSVTESSTVSSLVNVKPEPDIKKEIFDDYSVPSPSYTVTSTTAVGGLKMVFKPSPSHSNCSSPAPPILHEEVSNPAAITANKFSDISDAEEDDVFVLSDNDNNLLRRTGFTKTSSSMETSSIISSQGQGGISTANRSRSMSFANQFEQFVRSQSVVKDEDDDKDDDNNTSPTVSKWPFQGYVSPPTSGKNLPASLSILEQQQNNNSVEAKMEKSNDSFSFSGGTFAELEQLRKDKAPSNTMEVDSDRIDNISMFGESLRQNNSSSCSGNQQSSDRISSFGFDSSSINTSGSTLRKRSSGGSAKYATLASLLTASDSESESPETTNSAPTVQQNQSPPLLPIEIDLTDSPPDIADSRGGLNSAMATLLSNFPGTTATNQNSQSGLSCDIVAMDTSPLDTTSGGDTFNDEMQNAIDSILGLQQDWGFG